MPSMSPSPVKRPSMVERSSSTHSLSSQGKQAQQQRVHRVTRHSRNVSHGKALNKLGKINSTTNIAADGRNHTRKKSGQTTPGPSPKTPTQMKRNSSQANLPKNTSHGNLRKNQSAKELAAVRNVSQSNLKKLGAPPSQKTKDDHKQGFFELGNQSSGEEDEGEWEDSTTTHSPELSRNHSKASTPLRSRTPNGEHEAHHPPATEVPMIKQIISPTSAALKSSGKSVPELHEPRVPSSEPKLGDPALLHQPPRMSRAPPAMSTVSAHVKRSDSARSFTQISRPDTSRANLQSSSSPTGVGATSSSGSHGVSHFLPSSSSLTTSGGKPTEDLSADDDDDETGFMSNYKPQPQESPEKLKLLNRARVSSLPSRTQQKLELQRRETMRASAAASASPSTPGLGLSVGSSVSLHSRSGSKGRNRSIAGDPKVVQHDYEAGIKQLTVVRRFRNPILDSLHRLQESQAIPSEAGSLVSSTSAGASSGDKSRPQSRRGPGTNANGAAKDGISRSPEDKKQRTQSQPNPPPSAQQPQHSRANSRSRLYKVQFQTSRQGSHEDILAGTTSPQGGGSPGDFGDEAEQDDGYGDVSISGSGISPEEALIRRIWESRVVFESDGVQSSA